MTNETVTMLVGKKTVTYVEGNSIPMADVIQRKNASTFYDSVSIHPDGTVHVEAANSDYRDKHCKTATVFEKNRKNLHKELTKIIPLLIAAGFYSEETKKRIIEDSLSITFYSTPYDCFVYNSIIFDNDFNLIDIL